MSDAAPRTRAPRQRAHEGGKPVQASEGKARTRVPRSDAVPSAGRSGRWRAKRESIVKMASRLFSERGFAYVSLDDIARSLGIGKPVIYYYFESKEQILFECYSSAFDVADVAMETALALDGSGARRLESYLRTYLLAHLRGDAPLKPMHDIRALSDPLRGRIERRRRARRDQLRDLIAEGLQDGSLAPCDPRVVVSAWGGASSWVIESYDARKGLSPEETAEQMVALFMRGLSRNL